MTFPGFKKPFAPEGTRHIERERNKERKMSLGNKVTFFSLDFVADCVDFPLRFSVFALYSTSWTSQKWDRSRPAGKQKYVTLRWKHTWLISCAFKFRLVAGYCTIWMLLAKLNWHLFLFYCDTRVPWVHNVINSTVWIHLKLFIWRWRSYETVTRLFK